MQTRVFSSVKGSTIEEVRSCGLDQSTGTITTGNIVFSFDALGSRSDVSDSQVQVQLTRTHAYLVNIHAAERINKWEGNGTVTVGCICSDGKWVGVSLSGGRVAVLGVMRDKSGGMGFWEVL